MATTTNYSWTTPDDTGLVKDGASAIRSLGTSIDTTTKNLNPSTTLGDIEYRSSTANTNTRLGIGSTGNILTVAGGVPTWAAPVSGGGMTLLSTTTLSGASTTISSISGSYYALQLIIYGANVSSAGGVLVVRPNADTNLSSGAMIENNNGSAGTGVFSSSGIELGYNAGMLNSNTNNIFSIVFDNYASSSNYKSFNAQYGYARDPSGIVSGQLGGAYRSNTAISSLVVVASGTFSAGTALLYGVK